jgi:hypothetical protein
MAEDSPYPRFLTHYYESARGPFRSLSSMRPDAAEAVLETIRREGAIFASKRSPEYLAIRRDLEQTIRRLFIEQGGTPRRMTPHYMIVGACPWVMTWYAQGCELRVPLEAFDPAAVSLTYGDSFPAMRYGDGKPYRGKVYRLDDLPDLVARYGLPQVWNADGQGGPDRYIEAQVWDDAPLRALGWITGGERGDHDQFHTD